MKMSKLSLFIIGFAGLLVGQATQQLPLPPTGTEPQTPILYREYDTVPLALERPIDPESYHLGPGDRLRIRLHQCAGDDAFCSSAGSFEPGQRADI